MGIRLGELADSSLYAVKLGDFRLLTCASPTYLARRGCPTSPEELAAPRDWDRGKLGVA